MNPSKTPSVRFKGYEDEWEERKLKDVVEKQIKGKAQFEKLAPGDVEYLDTSRLNGGQAILTNGLKDVTLDDVLILWDGSKAGTVYHGFEGSLGSTLKAYRTSADSKFVYQYLKRYQDNIYNNYRTPNIPHVQKDFLDVFTISVPRSDEQAKIGSFFKQLDNTITLHQRKLNLLNEQKKGFLQKMFPKNGEKIPEIRFAGFNDDWEDRKVSDFSKTTYGGGTPKTAVAEYWDGNIPWIQSSNLTVDDVQDVNLDKFITDDAIKNSAAKLIPANSIAIVTRVGVGKLTLMKQEFATSQDFLSLSDLQVDEQFGLYSIYKLLKKELNNIQGTSIKGMTKADLLTKDIMIPTEKNEQAKVGAFFQNLDNTITLHQ
uniref:restriction endonuclease subunit S n=1 Tax=uncultured Enterococcus sp. TaxID=167972 RepID=UPI002592EBAB